MPYRPLTPARPRRWRKARQASAACTWASSSEAGVAIEVQRLSEVLQKQARPGLQWQLEKMPEESHGTIYHPAALRAFRAVFKAQGAASQ